MLDPVLTADRRADASDALARLDEYKAGDMDAAFAKFGVKARARALHTRLAPLFLTPSV